MIQNAVDFPRDDPTSTIVAKRDILENEEITLNYSPFMNPYQKFECNCGSENCVGIIKKLL